MDRSLWNCVWTGSARTKPRPAEFANLLDAGASPWASYKKQDGVGYTVLEGLCRSSNADFSYMLHLWIKQVGKIGSVPPGHPPPLCCLPLDASVGAVDKLLSAGADAADPMVLQKWFQMGLADRKRGVEAEGFWLVAARLLEASGRLISDISLPGCVHRGDLLQAIAGGGLSLPEQGVRVLLAHGQWDFPWRENSPHGEWLRHWLVRTMANASGAPEWFSSAGLDWLGVDDQGNNLAHLLVSRTIFSYDGKELLPVEALEECLAHGISLTADNAQGWSALQRINLVDWANEENLASLRSSIARQSLHEATVPASSHAARRL